MYMIYHKVTLVLINPYIVLMLNDWMFLVLLKLVVYYFFFGLVCGVGLTSPGTAATSGLLYSPR
jgi:hypothetical protein